MRPGSKLILFTCFPGVTFANAHADNAKELETNENASREQAALALLAKARDVVLAAPACPFARDDIREIACCTNDMRSAIVDFADTEAVDSIVVGCRGIGVLKRVVLGSTSSYLVQHATCPVVVCR